MLSVSIVSDPEPGMLFRQPPFLQIVLLPVSKAELHAILLLGFMRMLPRLLTTIWTLSPAATYRLLDTISGLHHRLLSRLLATIWTLSAAAT
jgi:hypothetical protein